MLIGRSIKRKIWKKTRAVGIFLVRLYFILAILYSFWLWGRITEYKKFEKAVEEFKWQTIQTYYFVQPEVVDPFVNTKKDTYIKGELITGYCTEKESLEKLINDY